MNYSKIYDQLIEKSKNRTLPEGQYVERHHIVPRCMGGTDDIENIAVLLPREHFMAHWLLYKIHRTSKLAHAWFMMFSTSGNQKRYKPSSRQYGYAREAHSKAVSKQMSGKGNSFYGKRHSQEVKDRIGEKNKGRKRSPENIAKFLEATKGPNTPEQNRKIGRKGFVMIQNVETLEIRRVTYADLNLLDKNVWVNPRKITPEKKYKCDHCNMVTTPSNLKRWHNDNCKEKA